MECKMRSTDENELHQIFSIYQKFAFRRFIKQCVDDGSVKFYFRVVVHQEKLLCVLVLLL